MESLYKEIPKETLPILADVISSCLVNKPEDRIDTKGINQLFSTSEKKDHDES